MKIDIDNIIKQVRVIVDENEDTSALLVATDGDDDLLPDNDALQTEEISKAMVLQAIDRVHYMAPVLILNGAVMDLKDYKLKEGSKDDRKWNRYELVQRLTLPDDVLRVTRVKLDNWCMAVTQMVEEGSGLYSTMFSRFGAVRPSTLRPMVGIAVGMEGGADLVAAPVNVPILPKYFDKVMEGYDEMNSVRKGEVSVVLRAKDGGYMADRCEKAVVYMVANLYYISIGEYQRASAMAQEVAELLGLDVKQVNDQVV